MISHRITVTTFAALIVGLAAWIFLRSSARHDSSTGTLGIPTDADDATASDPLAVDALERAIREAPTEYARFAAALSLDKIGDPQALVILVGRFAVPDAAPAESFACEIALGRLAALDLSAAVSLARATAGALRARLSAAVFHGLGIPEPSAPLVTAVMVTDALDDERAVALLRLLVSGDHEVVLATLRQTAPASIHHLERARLAALLATDPAAAFEQVAAIDDRAARSEIARAILIEYAATDPAAAFEWSSRLGDPRDDYPLRLARAEIIKMWAATDFPGAQKTFFDSGFPLDRYTVDPITDALTDHDPALALEWANHHISSVDLRRSAESRVFKILGEKDPARATALLATPGQMSSAKIAASTGTFMYAWARSQPAEALAWTLSQSGEMREGALDGYLDLAHGENPAAVFALIESPSLADDERVELLRRAYSLAAHDLPRYLALAGTVPEKESFASLANAAGELARSGQLADARAIVEVIGIGTAPVWKVTQETVTELAKVDPNAAREWVDSFTHPDARKWGVRNLVDAWARHDPAAAGAYVESLTPGTAEHEQAAFVMAERTLGPDPAAAIGWLDSLTDPSLRSRFLSSNITALVTQEPGRLAALAAGDSALQKRIDHEKAWQAVLRGDSPPPE
ncbi:hypothetical protein BH23VER1_BH23VER1_19890 [soil metagenome]